MTPEIIEIIFDLLSKEKQSQFKILVKNGNKEKIQEFINSILPEIENCIEQILFARLPKKFQWETED